MSVDSINKFNNIKYFKIYGERNSGTNFLYQFLKKNTDLLEHFNGYNGGTGWKHGYTKFNLFNSKIRTETLFVIIIRDLEDWLVSMFKNPYHYKIKKSTSIFEFVNGNLNPFDVRKDHDVNIYKNENMNIVKLRYSKINDYLEFYNKVENIIFINLEDIQKNNKKFIDFLKNKFKINTKHEIVKISKHTKINKNIVKINYNLKCPIIKHKNDKIEKFVENLKTQFYYKSSQN